MPGTRKNRKTADKATQTSRTADEKVDLLLSKVDAVMAGNVSDTALLDEAIWMIFEEGWETETASSAFRVLKSEFVDWNEVRVSTESHLTDFIRSHSKLSLDSALERKVHCLLALLDRVHRDRFCLSLDFLMEWDAEQRRDYVRSIDLLATA